jgi:hypothetical protein
MSLVTMLVLGLIRLPAAGLVAWAWFVMTQVEEHMRSFSGFDGMLFEIGSQAVKDPEAARWPIPG